MPQLRAITHPRILFAALFLFWCSVCLSFGPGRHLFSTQNITEGAFLSSTFKVWENHSPLEHGGLEFLSETEWQGRTAYSNRSLPYLLAHYALLKPLYWLGVPYEQGESLLVFVYALLNLTLMLGALLLVGTVGDGGSKAEGDFGLSLVMLCLVAALGATMPTLWIDAVRAHDNPIRLLNLGMMIFVLLDVFGKLTPKISFLILILCCSWNPIFGPFALLVHSVYAVSVWIPERRIVAADLRTHLIVLAVVSGLFFFLPKLIVVALGFKEIGNSFIFRSGLNGDGRYFSSSLGAVFAPFRPEINRGSSVFALPLLALSAGLWQTFVQKDRLGGLRILRILGVGLLPYLYFVILFPQWVSIHPYVFDCSLALPGTVATVVWFAANLTPRRNAPWTFIAMVLLGTGMVMNQLIEISRFFP